MRITNLLLQRRQPRKTPDESCVFLAVFVALHSHESTLYCTTSTGTIVLRLRIMDQVLLVSHIPEMLGEKFRLP